MLSGPEAPEVALIASESLYAPGDTLSAELINRSDEAVGYGACSLRLEHLGGRTWSLVGPEEVPRIDVLSLPQPGGTRVLRLYLDPILEPGTYRLP